jgi:3-oxoacyl-[acyl-carrier protein] reductase
MDVNLRGTYFVVQKVAKYMVRNKIQGHILNISSSTALEPAWSPYRLSKWGIRGLTLGLAQQLRPYGIIVNAIAPGSTATGLLGVKEGDSIWTSDNNQNRFIMPDEIASYAKMMCCSLGDIIVGDTLYISGGKGIIDRR